MTLSSHTIAHPHTSQPSSPSSYRPIFSKPFSLGPFAHSHAYLEKRTLPIFLGIGEIGLPWKLCWRVMTLWWPFLASSFWHTCLPPPSSWPLWHSLQCRSDIPVTFVNRAIQIHENLNPAHISYCKVNNPTQSNTSITQITAILTMLMTMLMMTRRRKSGADDSVWPAQCSQAGREAKTGWLIHSTAPPSHTHHHHCHHHRHCSQHSPNQIRFFYGHFIT